MRTLVFVAALLVPASAGAVTFRDIIELTKAGLPDEVLVAVIDADRTIFTLDKDQILELKRAGVGRQVLLKMLRTRREFEPSTTSGQEEQTTPSVTESQVPQPGVVVIGAQPAPPPVTVVVPQYFYVPYAIWGTPAPHAPRTPPPPFLAPGYRGFGRFINDGWVDRRNR
jgi:hypothetical protein